MPIRLAAAVASPPGRPGRRHSRDGPRSADVLQRQYRRRDGDRKDLRRGSGRLSRRLSARFGLVPASLGQKVAARDPPNGTRRSRRHCAHHRRPGTGSAARRPHPVRRVLAGAGQARLPLDAGGGGAGCAGRDKQSGAGGHGRDRAAPLLPEMLCRHRRRRRRASHLGRAGHEEAPVSCLWEPPLAGGSQRPAPLPPGRLHRSPHVGLLRLASGRRVPRAESAWLSPGSRRRRSG